MPAELSTLHKILSRQLRKEFGTLDRVPAELWPLLEAVSGTYEQADEERRLLEHSMKTLSEELVERYERSRENERAYRLLFDSNPAPMWVYDPATLRFLAVNDAAVRRYGWSREEFLERNLLDIRCPEDARLFVGSVRPGTGLVHAGIYRHQTRTGELVDVEITSHDVFFAGGLARLVLSVEITERLRAENELRESEQRFRTVAEGLGEALFITDLDDTILYANARVVEVTGYSPAEVVGRKPRDFMVEPQDVPRMHERLQERENGHTERYEIRFIRKDGTRVWCEVSGTPYRDAAGRVIGTIGAVTDVTARREARAAQERAAGELAESLSLLQATLESTADGILVVDTHGRLTSWNRRFLEMWRVTEADMASRDGDRLVAQVLPQLRDPDDWAAGILALGGETDAESFDVLEFVDGRIVERYSRPQRVGGRIVGRVWSFRDVTARVHAEDELRHAQKMNAVGRLAGGVAHDFNNLLTVIRNNAELCLLALADEHRARGDVEEIVAAADRATSLTRQLLAFGRKQVARPRVIDLNVAVSEAERLLRRLLPADIAIVTTLDPSAPRVAADPGQLEQVLMNLAVNARDAMPDGGMLALRTEPADAPDEDERPWVALVVSDTGHGMDEETRSRIFEPFFTTKGPGQGTGLGLATVYGIVEQSGGRVQVESLPGEGATFTILFPIAPAGAADGARARRTSGGYAALETRASPTGTTVLLVEDEDAVRSALRRTLEICGYEVIEAHHGVEALRLVEERGAPPDLVLTDVVMPQMGGRDLVEALRARYPSLRVLFVSGHTDWESLPAGIGDGRTDFLPKPSPTEVVLGKVAELLAR